MRTFCMDNSDQGCGQEYPKIMTQGKLCCLQLSKLFHDSLQFKGQLSPCRRQLCLSQYCSIARIVNARIQLAILDKQTGDRIATDRRLNRRWRKIGNNSTARRGRYSWRVPIHFAKFAFLVESRWNRSQSNLAAEAAARSFDGVHCQLSNGPATFQVPDLVGRHANRPLPARSN